MRKYVPPEKRDSSWAIFNRLFMCKIREIDTMSADYIKLNGIPSIYNKAYDKDAMNELVIRMLTINDMVELRKKGVNIRIVHDVDTKNIYDVITEHLNTWTKALEVGLNHTDAPIEDLITLDEFASVIYQHAQRHFTREIVDSLVLRNIAKLPFSTQSILGNFNVVKPSVPEQELEAPARESMADTFANYHSFIQTFKNRG